MRLALLCVLCVWCVWCVGVNAATHLPLGPTIGILGLPRTQCDSALRRLPGSAVQPPANATSCFTVFYERWLSAMGARTVPLAFDTPTERLRELYEAVDGILFTGGDVVLGPDAPSPNARQYFHTAKTLYSWVLADAATSATPTPLWGTCVNAVVIVVVACGVCLGCFCSRYVDVHSLSLCISSSSSSSSSSIFVNYYLLSLSLIASACVPAMQLPGVPVAVHSGVRNHRHSGA